MCITSLKSTMARIKVATPYSPIAVFIVEKVIDDKTCRFLDSRFANTVDAAQRKTETAVAKPSDENQTKHTYEWVGDYHKFSQVKAVRALLIVALEK